MSQRIRGQEVTVRVAVDGQIQEGSMFKVKEFTSTPRTDLVEEDYLGELESDIDIQHHGFDFSFSIDNQDQIPLELLSEIITREQTQQQHPAITMTVIYAYRETDASNRVEVYHDVFLKVADQGFSGRKDYVTTSFEGKCKKRSLLSA
jgi:hypothetical protein